MDGNEHEPADPENEGRREKTADDRAERPISFDFKLRLGSRDSSASLTARGGGELVQVDPIDWDSLTGLVDDDVRREYKTDGDLPSIIVELANQIAGPDTLAQRALRMNALARQTEDTDPADHNPAPVPPTQPADIAVATVDDDPMLSAVVGQILDAPTEPPVHMAAPPATATSALAPPAPAAPGPAPVAAASVAEVPAPPTTPAPPPPAPSALAPAVSAPVEAVPEGPIELPRIVSLTPDLPSGEVVQPSSTPPSLPSVSVPVVAGGPISAPVQMLTNAEAMSSAAAQAPVAPAAPLQLARIERKPGAERPTKPVDFHALLVQAGMQPQTGKRRKKRHPFRTLLKLVVVLGIIGGGLFFGKKYVLDMRWSSELKPYADAVSTSRQLKWTKAVDVTTLPAAEYAQHLTTLALGPAANESDLGSEWRAMGLLEGPLDLATVAEYSAAFRPVMYDTTDRVIYQRADLPDDLREFALYEAMTLSLLDQSFNWSTGIEALGPAARSGRLALVEADAASTALEIVHPSSRELERINAQGHELGDVVGASMAGALDYPSDVLIGPGDEARNLFGQDVLPSIDGRNKLIQASAATDAAVLDGLRSSLGDPEQIGDPVNTRGMAYWYYVLAGRMGPADAWNAAVGWNGDETLLDSTAEGKCVSATIATVDPAGQARLLAALQGWAAAGPSAALPVVTELDASHITVKSCDPGPEADTKRDDGIQPWGMADVEYGLVSELTLDNEEDARVCTINALRNYDVLKQAEAGDTDGAKLVTDQILASCSDG